MKKTVVLILLALVVIGASLMVSGCFGKDAQSSSGAKQVNAVIDLGSDGMTVEQEHIKKRIEADNEDGIKYLYIVSAYSGDIIYSDVVDGKVTSDGKRLAPKTSSEDMSGSRFWYEISPGNGYWTNEVMNDDGTYGDADVDYFFYWTPQGQYRQVYITGGMMPIISDTPMSDFGQVVMHVESK